MLLLKLSHIFSNLCSFAQSWQNSARSSSQEALTSDRITEKMIFDTSKKFSVNPKLLSFLGKGVFSQAFLYKNKVIKFTLSHKDVEALLKLTVLAHRLGNTKHVLKIYNIEHDSDNGLYMIETEYLEPLDPHVHMMLFSAPQQGGNFEYQVNRKLFEILKDRPVIETMLNLSWLNLEERVKDRLRDSRQKIYDLVKNFIAERGKAIVQGESLTRYIMLLLQETTHYVRKHLPHLQKGDIYDFVNGIHGHLDRLLKQRFPRTSRDAEMNPTSAWYYESIPESSSVMEFLYALQKHNVSWNDLHGKNLMQRPNGGKDIVISDPGLFEFMD